MLVFYKATKYLIINHFVKHQADKGINYLLRCVLVLTFTIIRICQPVKFTIIMLANVNEFHFLNSVKFKFPELII